MRWTCAALNSEFLTGALAEAEQRLASLSTRAATAVERAMVACLRVDLYTTLDQSSRAIAAGLDYLRYLGIDWSPHPTEEEAQREYDRIWSQLAGRRIDELIEAPLMTDPASLASLDVLNKLGSPAFNTDANLHALVVCRAVNLSIERGHCDASSAAYTGLAAITGPRFGDYQSAFRFGQLGYELVEKGRLTRFQARIYQDFGSFVLPWMKHIRASRDLLRRAFDAANNTGDLTYAAYCCIQMNANMLAAGDPLAEAEREAEHGLAFAQKARFGYAADIITTQLVLIRMLRGMTPTFGFFDDNEFDMRRVERRFSENRDLAFVEGFYWICNLQARFLAGGYSSAVAAASSAKRLLPMEVTQIYTVDYHYYSALSRAAACNSAPADMQQQHIDAAAAHHKQLRVWAEHCPENFENCAALVGAEIARLDGRPLDAESLYEQAIRSARSNGFVHNEAHGCEIAARFYAARGFEDIAEMYLGKARDAYRRWGAEGKVRQLETHHPQLAMAAPRGGEGKEASPDQQLDVAAVVKASQALSSEMLLPRLIERLMTIALQNAGADRGLLILPHQDDYRVEAEARTDREGTVLHYGAPAGPAAPGSIIRFVTRTQETVIVDDAVKQKSLL